ncbi:hypothetical protein [Microbacterium sp. LWH3-1.2]|uniref:hypothetical protein n=1 Tax=Microbacterium sp. LWH3-1.2 TaxID=3135256 RepID=UPI003428BE9C
MRTAPVHVIPENPDWFAPLAQAFPYAGIPVREWLAADDTALELSFAVNSRAGSRRWFMSCGAAASARYPRRLTHDESTA